MNLFPKLKKRFAQTPIEEDLTRYLPLLTEIRKRETRLIPLTNEVLKREVGLLQPDDLAGIFAVTCEVAYRTLNMRPYDVQIIGGLAMLEGNVVEMQTGEGKTLAATLPAVFQVFSGRSVHIHTFNDYLARRDAAWMEPIFQFMGVSVGVIQEEMSTEERVKVYQRDIVYLTAKQGGFDYLRDQLCTDLKDRVQHNLDFAIIDEVDSLLIDEARIPLVIAGEAPPEQPERYRMITEFVAGLNSGPDSELNEYETDEHHLNIFLTDAGIHKIETRLGIEELYHPDHEAELVMVNQALHAHFLLHRDIDYIVREGRIELVDEFTGRVVADRKWPYGLQAAIEAKEGLEIQPGGKILGKTTLPHFFNHYAQKCGMTGTARAAAKEFRELYGMGVTVIPPHLPNQRLDHPDRIFPTKEAKLDGLITEIHAVHETGRPILVGTANIEASEAIAAMLNRSGLPCKLLNARNDEAEAAIIAEAGKWKAITISTNMAGRGTDIKPGGEDGERKDEILVLGGLYVIGTNRFESKRIDNQLRGRAGRQGDPGSSCFFISLKDDLLRKNGIEDLIPKRLKAQTTLSNITHAVIRRELERVQRIIEAKNFEMRYTLWKYAHFTETHQQILQIRRKKWLEGTFESVWAEEASEAYQELSNRFGEPLMREVEQEVSLALADRLWAEYLEAIDQVRQSIHLEVIGGRDPVMEFQKRSIEIFDGFLEKLDQEIIERLSTLNITENGIDLTEEGLDRPGSTWTYLINDNPFGDKLAMILIGNSNFGFAAFAAFWWPLLALYFLVKRLLRKK